MPMEVALPVKMLLKPLNVEVRRKYEASVGSKAHCAAVVPTMAVLGIQPCPLTSLAGNVQMRS